MNSSGFRSFGTRHVEALIFFLHFAESASQETKSVGSSIDRGEDQTFMFDGVESFSCFSYSTTFRMTIRSLLLLHV